MTEGLKYVSLRQTHASVGCEVVGVFLFIFFYSNIIFSLNKDAQIVWITWKWGPWGATKGRQGLENPDCCKRIRKGRGREGEAVPVEGGHSWKYSQGPCLDLYMSWIFDLIRELSQALQVQPNISSQRCTKLCLLPPSFPQGIALQGTSSQLLI